MIVLALILNISITSAFNTKSQTQKPKEKLEGSPLFKIRMQKYLQKNINSFFTKFVGTRLFLINSFSFLKEDNGYYSKGLETMRSTEEPSICIQFC